MFNGERYRLTFDGSFNGNEDLQALEPGQLAMGSRNIDTHNGGAEKRGGTQPVGSQIAASLSSLGAGILVKRNSGSIHHYWAGNNGTLYRNGSSIQTGRSTSARHSFTAADDEMYICNTASIPRVDTGSAISDITTAAADWTGSTHPRRMIVHTKGASRRMVAWGVPGKENTLYISSTGNFKQFAGGTSTTQSIEFSDGHGIINCVSKDGTLWIQGRYETWILDDSDASTANWGSYRASFKGGVHSPELCTVINNQIFAMNTEGDIYEVLTAEQLRDYKQASISETFFIHNYIRSEIDLTKIDQFHFGYDPKIKALRVFMVRTGQTTVDTCLSWLVNQGKWVPPHDSRDNASDSGFSASASYEIEVSSGQKKLYTQDYNGYTWELSSTTKTDNGNAYTAETLSGWLDFDLPSEEKRYVYGVLHYKSRGDYQVTIPWYIDNVQQVTRTISLAATAAVLDSFLLDTDTLAIIGVSNREFEFGEIGEKIRISVSNNGAGHDFFLSHIIIHFVRRGSQRQ